MKRTIIIFIVVLALFGCKTTSSEDAATKSFAPRESFELEILKISIGLKKGTLTSLALDFEDQKNSKILGTECSIEISANGEKVGIKFFDINGNETKADFSYKDFDTVERNGTRYMTATKYTDLLKELNIQFNLTVDGNIDRMRVYTVPHLGKRVDYSWDINF